MTTTAAHKVELDTAGRSADNPIRRGVRRSWTPWCRTCGWESTTAYPNQIAAGEAAVAHFNPFTNRSAK